MEDRPFRRVAGGLANQEVVERQGNDDLPNPIINDRTQLPAPAAADPADDPIVAQTRADLLALFSTVPHRRVDEVIAEVRNLMGPPQENYTANLMNQCIDRLILISAEIPTGTPSPIGTPEVKLKPEEIHAWILDMHPRADPSWVQKKVAEGFSLQRLADYMMDPNNNWPRVERKKVEQASKGTSVERKSIDCYWTEYEEPVSDCYIRAVVPLLGSDFPKIGIDSIRQVLRLHNNHYAPAKKAIEEGIAAKCLDLSGLKSAMKISVICKPPGHGMKKTVILNLLKGIRRTPSRNAALEGACEVPELQAELEWVQQKEEEQRAQAQPRIAVATTSSAPPDSGGFQECQICFGDTPLGQFSGCENSHIFCHTCIQNHAKQVAYGQGRPMVDCLEIDCNATFPKGILDRILDAEILGRLEDRYREENLNAAEIEGLERCKFCSYAIIFDIPKEVNKVFRCENPDCLAEVCRQCGLDWNEDHLGVPCQEMERDEAMLARREYEEKMTLEVIRYCPKCKIPIQKLEGCNKMTCRCGQKLCYLCREKGIDYNHFCQHPRNPGKGCDKCNRCSLWEDDKKYDLNRLKDIEKQALEDARIDATHAAGLKVPAGPASPIRPEIAQEANNNQAPGGMARQRMQAYVWEHLGGGLQAAVLQQRGGNHRAAVNQQRGGNHRAAVNQQRGGNHRAAAQQHGGIPRAAVPQQRGGNPEAERQWLPPPPRVDLANRPGAPAVNVQGLNVNAPPFVPNNNNNVMIRRMRGALFPGNFRLPLFGYPNQGMGNVQVPPNPPILNQRALGQIPVPFVQRQRPVWAGYQGGNHYAWDNFNAQLAVAPGHQAPRHQDFG